MGVVQYAEHTYQSYVLAVDLAASAVTQTINLRVGDALAAPPVLIPGRNGLFLYAMFGDSILVLDVKTGSLIETVGVTGTETGLLDMAITPDGAYLFATDFQSSQIDVVSTATLTVEPPIKLAGKPSGIAIR